MGKFDEYSSQAVTLGFIALTLAVIVIGIGALRTSEINNIGVTTVNNESLTLSNGTAVSLSNIRVSAVSQILVNSSGAWQVLGTANYTAGNLGVDSAGTVTLTQNEYNGNASLVTYTYVDIYSRESVNITTDGAQGIVNATSYFGTVGTLLGVGLIVMVVLLAFGALGIGRRE